MMAGDLQTVDAGCLPTGSSSDGVIVLWKPVGISSARAVYRVRSITGVRKSGHAGALDPGAEGVLIVCQGKATRLVERIMALPKVYRAAARLDVTSESLDSDSPLTPVPVGAEPSEDQVRGALARFVGTIEQAPPRISAVKIGGVPAYKRARRGEDVAPRPRPVRIDSIRLDRYVWPTMAFEMACGRGTYVRSLVRDVG
ncbi:MAG: tRNA pseudouridine(55) synthase TruB, partial [Phycisphaerales bacterium]|nr:tRNA pseudouridine(55) synthase TruB [Phycisphaerales bacterium]